MGGVGSGRKPRQYPTDVVEAVLAAYSSGATIAELRPQFPGYRVQTILERYLPRRRQAAKRNQRGPLNDSWKGGAAGYQALHLRVESQRGKPRRCEVCGTTEATRFHWANLTGDYGDVSDYARMCPPCHYRFDAARRSELGRNTAPARR